MKLLAVTCNHCGAPLEVPKRTRYITCAYCDARLQVHQTPGAVYTEVLESIAQRTDQIADRVERIELQNRLERLDCEWNMQRERYMLRGKDGQMHVPNRTAGMVTAVVGIVFGIAWMRFANGMRAPGVFTLFGVLFIAFAVIAGWRAVVAARAYERRQSAYHRERQSLTRALQGR